MHTVPTRAQVVHQARNYCHTVSDRVTFYLKNIKEAYASFIDRLLWNETGDVRQSSSGLKKAFSTTESPTALLSKPIPFIRSSDSTLEKTNIINPCTLLEKTAHAKVDIDPAFNRAEAIQEETERRAELNISNSVPIEKLTDKQLQQNKRFADYYTDSISLNFIQDAWLGSDGKVYNYDTLLHLNGINPITKAPLLAVADQRFLQELSHYQSTGIAPDILLDPYTNQVMQNPVFTTNGVRCDYSSAKETNPGAVMQKDFAAGQLLETLTSNQPTHTQPVECNSVADCLSVIDQDNCSPQQRQIVELAYQQQDALRTDRPRSYVGHTTTADESEISSIMSTGRQFTMADIVEMFETIIASAERREAQFQEMKNDWKCLKLT
ncbi:MAG: hypothetical protein V4629_10040 [Pseudomonadota bacterium]